MKNKWLNISFKTSWWKRVIKILFTLSFAYTLLIINYVLSNRSITNYEEEKLITRTGICLNKFFGHDKTNTEELQDVVFINISNDKELIEVYDETFHIPKGNLDITDRRKIALFLNKADNNHKFILLDVIFDSIHKSKNDSLLQDALDKTKNIALPFALSRGALTKPLFNANVIGVAAYRKSIYTNRFVKYRYLENDTLGSIALKMSEEINGNHIEKKDICYYDNGRLCLNSIILNHRVKPIIKYDEYGRQKFYNLGVDILQSMSDKEIQNLIYDKIVLIGDYDDRDLHPTVYGKIPGVIINYNAYLSLKYKEHIIPLSLITTLYLIYLSLTILILFSIDTIILKKLKKGLLSFGFIRKCSAALENFKLKNVITHFIGSFFEMGFLMTLITLLYFSIFGIYIEVLVSAGFFSVLIVIRDKTKSSKIKNPADEH